MNERFLHRTLLILAIIVLVLFAAHMVMISYRDLQEIGVLQSSSSPRSIPRLSPRRQKFTPTPSDVNLIQSWMTIAYVNRMFNLPIDYLKTEFDITNPKYPNIVLEDIARSAKTPINGVLELYRERIAEYLRTVQAQEPI